MLSVKSEQILKKELSQKKVSYYTVSGFCKSAKVNRRVFYHYYSNLSDLFTSVLTLQLRRTLRCGKDENMDQMFYRMLEQIRVNKILYLNMLRITKDTHQFYTVLRKEIAQDIELYMRPRGRFSVRQIEVVANGTYAIIFNWVLDDCSGDIRDVYQSIHLLLVHIERGVNTTDNR